MNDDMADTPAGSAGTGDEEVGGLDEAATAAAMRVLDSAECWARLASTSLGRLAFVVAGEVEIFPINYVVDGSAIVFRTGEGTKLAGLALAGPVAFEIDGYDEQSGLAWSVIAKGQAHRLDRSEELDHADALDLRPWLPSLKPYFVRLEHLSVTGRAFPYRS